MAPRTPPPPSGVLLDREIAVLETSAQRAVGDKTERLAVLNMPAEEAMELVASRRKRAPLRYAVTELLCTLGAASTKELCYFTGASPATLRSLEKSGILTLEKHEVLRRVRVEDVEPAGPVELNQEQEAAFRRPGPALPPGEGGRRPAVRRHRQRKDPNLYPPDPGGAGQGADRHGTGARRSP